MPTIKYEHLSFENGYVYRSCEVPLHEQGLVLIRGLNLDDGGYLGSGKSSLFEVFSHVQLGKGGKTASRKTELDSIVNWSVGSDYSAVLRYTVDGHPYEIRQYRKHKLYKNRTLVIDRETGRNIIPRSGARFPHKWIREEHLKLDETSFFNLVYLRQELNHVLLHGRDYEVRKKLTSMFGLDIFDKLYSLAHDRIKTVGGNLESLEKLEAELTNLNAQLQGAEDLEELQENQEQQEKSLSALQESLDETARRRGDLRDLFAKIEIRRDLALQAKTAWDNSKLSKLVNSPKDIDDDLVKRLEKKSESYSEEYVLAKDQADAFRRRNIIEQKLSKISGRDIEDVDEELSEVRTQLARLKGQELPQAQRRMKVLEEMAKLDRPKKSLLDIRTKLEDVLAKETTAQQEIKVLTAQLRDNVCSACKRPFDIQQDQVDEMKVKLERTRSQHGKLRDLRFQLRDMIEGAEAYKTLESQLEAIDTTRSPREIQTEIQGLLKKERELTEEYELSKQRLELNGQLKELPVGTVNDQLLDRLRLRSSAAKMRGAVAQKILNLLNQIEDLPMGDRKDIAAQIDSLTEESGSLSEDLKVLSLEVARTEERIATISNLQNRRDKVQKGLSRGSQILNNKRCLESLKSAFGNQGLKNDRFQSILREATETTVPLYSSTLWPKSNIDLCLSDQDGSIQFQLRRKNGNIITGSDMLSGGERHKAGLAFLFGMRDLKEVYTESSSNVLIVDEPFGSLDPQGTSGLMRILQILKQKFGSVFVISHRPEVLNHPAWDKVWWAVRNENESTLYRGDLPQQYQEIAQQYSREG